MTLAKNKSELAGIGLIYYPYIQANSILFGSQPFFKPILLETTESQVQKFQKPFYQKFNLQRFRSSLKWLSKINFDQSDEWENAK